MIYYISAYKGTKLIDLLFLLIIYSSSCMCLNLINLCSFNNASIYICEKILLLSLNNNQTNAHHTNHICIYIYIHLNNAKYIYIYKFSHSCVYD